MPIIVSFASNLDKPHKGRVELLMKDLIYKAEQALCHAKNRGGKPNTGILLMKFYLVGTPFITTENYEILYQHCLSKIMEEKESLDE